MATKQNKPVFKIQFSPISFPGGFELPLIFLWTCMNSIFDFYEVDILYKWLMIIGT